MSDKKYNGWNSYETWAVALWMDNDGSDEYWAEQAKECEDVYELAAQIKDAHEEAIDEATSGQGLPGFAQDLLNSSMREVDWEEIAEHIWAEREPDEEEEEDTQEDIDALMAALKNPQQEEDAE